MIKIIRLDPKKDQKTIEEINNTIDELFRSYNDFLNDCFGKSLFPLCYDKKPVIEKKPELKQDWITLGDLIDKFYHKDPQKHYVSNICKKNEEIEEDYSNVKNIDHVI